jgi:hypothetical protein
MSIEGQPFSNKQSNDDAEFIRLQLGHAISTYQSLLTQLVQIITVLVIADATLVGYAISTQIAGVMLIGAFFPIMIIIVQLMVNKRSLPVIYTAVSIENKYKNANIDWLASTFISVTMSREYLNKIKIADNPDPAKRIDDLMNLPIPLFKGIYSYLMPIALVVITLIQIIIPIVLWHYGWRMF